MIVYYESNRDKRVRDILAVEHEVMTPTIPADMDIEKQIAYYEGIGMEFISLNYETGGAIFDYKVIVDESGYFMALQPSKTK